MITITAITIDNATPIILAADNDIPNSIANNVSSHPNRYTMPNIINGHKNISKIAIVLGFIGSPRYIP